MTTYRATPADHRDSSVHYHNDDTNDPFVTDHQRRPTNDDYWACYACDCTLSLESGCRCSCHSQRRHH